MSLRIMRLKAICQQECALAQGYCSELVCTYFLLHNLPIVFFSDCHNGIDRSEEKRREKKRKEKKRKEEKRKEKRREEKRKKKRNWSYS
ncbi:hypothetical protein WISP_86296 [Willisornis vidua]|uniref:Uncharacterized protein n=1 Tax=Willisornis vidua TaxID=1566151 RepID=A0ABQ9D310_9PASS|nr:hypothetical protein WISP_86296 [Willisornis vidua]